MRRRAEVITRALKSFLMMRVMRSSKRCRLRRMKDSSVQTLLTAKLMMMKLARRRKRSWRHELPFRQKTALLRDSFLQDAKSLLPCQASDIRRRCA